MSALGLNDITHLRPVRAKDLTLHLYEKDFYTLCNLHTILQLCFQ